MTKEETIEVLLILKDKLENSNMFHMCLILKSINIPCSFLKESRLEDIWLSNPDCAIMKNTWVINDENSFGDSYLQTVTEKKIECIDILLKQLGHE